MSLETRSNSALFKRAEQLKRWEESETNREPLVVNGRERKIKFSAGCVFLAACKAGDKEEIQRLLKKGADIHTSDVDGLTALHQACIDDNLDLVEFLVENGADVNKGDNEGWTPLHATASCGFLSIAKYLIENGANVAAVNNDGELPMDVAESDAMEDMLQQQIEERGIDAESARTEEERLMMTDAKNWLSSGYIQDKTHPKTGATALHVAAAKGYLKVMDILIKAGADIDAKDLDGWTPLHAASHWGQREACEILVENFCDMNIKNCVGQTPFDVADNDVVKVLEDLRKKQASLPKENIINRRKNIQRKPPQPPEENIITGIENKKETKLVEPVKPKVPEVQQVELKIQPEPTHNQSNIDTDDDIDSLSTETSDTASSDVSGESEVSDEEKDLEKKNKANKEDTRLPVMPEVKQTVPNTPAPTTPPKQVTTNEGDESGLTSWRRSGSLRSRIAETPKANLTLKIAEKESPAKVTQPVLPSKTESSLEVGLRRTQSFEGDEKFYRRYLELRAKINAGNSCPTLHATPMRSASLKEKHFARRNQAREETRLSGLASASPNTTAGTTVINTSPTTTSPQNNQVRSSAPVTPSTPTTPGGSKLSPANIFKNFFKSFVPPVRDEESETQRKAHAKRVRETRRSTQGVTLEEIKSAEQLVKKKQQQQMQQSNQLNNSEPGDEVVVNVHSTVPAIPDSVVNATKGEEDKPYSLAERRPSWRLKVDNGSKFMLEDARKNENLGDVVVRKTAVVTPVTETGDTTVTLPLRKKTDDKESQENDSRTAQATQAAIQRRRRPKRRSTGVVHVDMDEIDPDRQGEGGTGGGGDTDDSLSLNNSESGGEQSEASSRLNSLSREEENKSEATENGEIDYKKLYEQSLIVNDRLREKLRTTEEELNGMKAEAEKNAAMIRNSLSESEKRERRAMERKLSEMEEELKQLEQLKCENQRLKDENGALIRVISKLSK
ncbi:protein phosphatase 1 regulatory subunit 12A isoform X2 [Cimex lectularius]|uniref:Protein phosphatase 1 regulatory subunit 12B n=1 Tax=Cimex lectularius TaxID=79782 RepID=A0A8I6SAR1_CIMLE|nr:protein phosphatase 1 regulatory subunit 12A isoform X2 [Cimex lectularius]